MQNRLHQNKSAVRRSGQNHKDHKSEPQCWNVVVVGICQHCLELGHGIDWKNTKIGTSNQVYTSQAENLAKL